MLNNSSTEGEEEDDEDEENVMYEWYCATSYKKNEKKLTSCTSFLQIQVSLCLEFFVSHSIFTFPDEYLVQGMCIHFKFVFPVPAS